MGVMLDFFGDTIRLLPPTVSGIFAAVIILGIIALVFNFITKVIKAYFAHQREIQSRNLQAELDEKDRDLKIQRQDLGGESGNKVVSRLDRIYEDIKKINERNTGVSRQEFENLVSDFRSFRTEIVPQITKLIGDIRAIEERVSKKNE